jgi:hypothetical protein
MVQRTDRVLDEQPIGPGRRIVVELVESGQVVVIVVREILDEEQGIACQKRPSLEHLTAGTKPAGEFFGGHECVPIKV